MSDDFPLQYEAPKGLATNGEGTTVVRRHEGKQPEDGLGGGQAAWNALEEKYDCVGNATRQELVVAGSYWYTHGGF